MSRDCLNLLLDLFYPKKKKCVVCGFYGKSLLCEVCASAIKFINGRACMKCGKSLDDDYIDNICPDCIGNPHYFDAAFTCFEYEGLGRELIHSFKYKGCAGLSHIFAEYMVERISDEGINADYIVPVPIHDNKFKTRGYNQSKLIADALGKLIKIPVIECIIRGRDTERQSSLDRVGRISNVFDAFSPCLSYNIHNNNIILIDDIYTTGSTVDECSKVLKAMGAKNIYVLTAAAGKNT